MSRKYFPPALMAMILLATVAESAQAYVGPGAGISLLSALWALLAVIGSAILYIVLWPLRRLRKRRKKERESEHAQEEARTLGKNDSGSNAKNGEGTKAGGG